VLLEAFSNEICHSFCQKLIWNSALLFRFFALQKGGSNGGRSPKHRLLTSRRHLAFCRCQRFPANPFGSSADGAPAASRSSGLTRSAFIGRQWSGGTSASVCSTMAAGSRLAATRRTGAGRTSARDRWISTRFRSAGILGFLRGRLAKQYTILNTATGTFGTEVNTNLPTNFHTTSSYDPTTPIST
jgi:hypothetical protein